MKTVVVIMAGGMGERFWPKSTKEHPKQFLNITDEKLTMIQLTLNRIKNLVNVNDIFVATNKNHVELVKKQLPEILEENIIIEPCSRNTAPCIGYAATIIKSRYIDANMIVLPSDHVIHDNNAFINTIKKAIEYINNEERIVTIGITPDKPETGYGYIKVGKKLNDDIYEVDIFTEKPNIEKAKQYITKKNYYWNSGMFVFKASLILDCFKKNLPKMYKKLIKLENKCNSDQVVECFSNIEGISFDYGILEKSDKITLIEAKFDWDDVGCWSAIDRHIKNGDNNNIISNSDLVITEDTINTTVLTNKKTIATIGLDNIVIIDTDDVILICDKDKTQDVKKVIMKIKKMGKDNLL